MADGTGEGGANPTQEAAGAVQQNMALHSSGSGGTDVKVVVRVRPQTLEMELQPGVQACVSVEGYNVCTVRSPHETVSMPFNWVAGPATTQSEFFKVVGRPTVENCLSGFNSSIFAYGQTGSGKTHTMIGQLPDSHSSLPADAGLIPRIFRYLWARMPEVAAGLLANPSSSGGSLASSTSSLLVGDGRRSLHADDGSRGAEQPSLKWLVRCSMLEIHREDVYDLLRPGTGPLNVREDIRKGVYVEGLCEKVVEDVSDALEVLREGTRNRQVAATDMNAASSRSHCIFTCHIESRLEPQPGMVNVRSSRLHLVDLAGSERLKTSWASAAATAAAAGGTGAAVSSSWDGGSMSGGGGGGGNSRLREMTSINSSLTVLGLVILRLTEQQPHIPYRNSKLTFLLQDSIGGNAKTVIVANVSPSEACLQETLSTLGFAARARKIVNKAVVNEDNNDDVALLRQKVRRLHQELALARALAAKATAGLRVSDASSSLTAREAAQQAAHEAAAEAQELQDQLEGALQLISDLECRNSELEQAREFWLRERNELEQNCLEARQDLEAMKVSLQQALKEAKKKPRWLPDMLGKAAQQQHGSTAAGASPSAGAAHVAEASTPSSTGRTPPQQQGSSSKQQQGSPGWIFSSMFSSKKDRAKAAAAAAAAAGDTPAAEAGEVAQDHQGGHPTQQQEQAVMQQYLQQQQHVLQLVSRQLQELTTRLCQDSCHTAQAASEAHSLAGEAAADTADVGLLELEELQQQQHQGLPQLQTIVAALRALAAWQQQQQQKAQQQHQQPPITGSAPSKPGSSKVAPSELHRQLFEERELTAQLQARIRQLQQELLLAGGPAGAATVPLPTPASVTPAVAHNPAAAAARVARLSPGVGMHHSADAALQAVPALATAPVALEAAFAQVVERDAGGSTAAAGAQDGATAAAAAASAAAAGDSTAEQHAECGVTVQVGIAADSSEAGDKQAADQQQQQEQQAAAAAAAATIAQQQEVIADLRAQLAALQERFEATQRERSTFNSKLQSMRSVLAAARCSTPSSMLSSSGLASPQQSFGALEPVFGSSICEEGEEEEEVEEEAEAGLRLTESFSCWQPQPEATSPVRLPKSDAEAAACADVLLGDLGPSFTEEMSEAEVWQQHHSQIQKQQEEYDRKEQLAKAVHAAIKTGALLGYRTFSDSVALAQHKQQHAEQQQPQQLPPADPCEQHQQPAAAMQDVQHEEQQQQPPAWLEQPLDTASSGSETTRSNCSTRGSSYSGSEAAEGEPCEGWPAASRSEGWRSLSHAAEDAEPCRSAGHAATEHAAPGALTAAAPAGTAAAENAQQPSQLQGQGEGEASERWPAWDASAYEEEIRQLSDQLQSYVSANSHLKGVLQQREAELKAQSECLQQQGHELNCCQDFVEELEQRLKEADAAAAAAQAEHCDAVWLKGQAEGLRGLNEALQCQLEELGQELELRTQQVEDLQLLLQRYSQQDSTSSAQQPAAVAGPGFDAGVQAAEMPAAGAAGAAVAAAAVDASTQTAGSADSPGKLGTQQLQRQLPATADDDAPHHEAGQHDQECRSPSGAAHHAGGLQVQAASPAHTPGSKRSRHAALSCSAAGQVAQPVSPFKQLRVHTHQLRAEPHNTQVATEQRNLLQQQIVAMGLVMRRQQLEQQLSQVRQQLQGLQGDQAGNGVEAMSRLCSPAQLSEQHPGSPHQDQLPQSPARMPLLPKQSRLAPSGSSSPQAVAVAAVDAEAPSRLQRSAGMLAVLPCAVLDSPIVCGQGADAKAGSPLDPPGSSPEPAVRGSTSSNSSTASTPRSTSSSGDSTELLNELNELAEGLQQLACASHQASTFKAVSASTLRCSQQLPVGAGSTAVSGAGSPVSWQQQAVGSPGSADGGTGALLQAAAALDADATLKLQADLQVSSAYELAATRGLLHAGAVVQELRSALTSTRHTAHKAQHTGARHAATAGKLQQAGAAVQPACSPGSLGREERRRQQQHTGQDQQRQWAREQSPPVVRTLFSSARESADMSVSGSLDVTRPPGAGPQQQESVSILRQLQQQQQFIIQVLGSMSAMQQPGDVAGSSPPAALPLQQLSDAQQQLQVLLHVAGALVQQADQGDSGSTADGRQSMAAADAGAGHARDTNMANTGQQGSGCWAAVAASAAAQPSPDAGSPARQRNKSADLQQLLGSSPDQQQQRDSSPDKLRRSQRGRPWLGSVCLAPGQQQPDAAGSSSPVALLQVQQHGQDQQDQQQQQQAEELVQMRGQVVQLQLELQRARQQVLAAESLIGSGSSLLAGRRSATPDHGWARQSLDSVSTPAGAASGVATAASTGATAASGSSACTPSQLLLLNGRNKELQAQCLQREGQVRVLESEVRRLQLELRQQQQALAAAAAAPAFLGGAAGAAAGGLTPRGAVTPRHGLASIAGAGAGPSLFSPQRRAASSPGTSGTPGRSFGAAAAAASGMPAAGYGVSAAAAASPRTNSPAVTQPAFMPTTRFASGLHSASNPEAQAWLAQPHLTSMAAAPESRAVGPDAHQPCVLGPHAGSDTWSVRASLDEVSSASSSSRSRGRGIKVGSGKPPLHVPSLARRQR